MNNEVNNFILGNFGFKNINDNNDDNCIICINILNKEYFYYPSLINENVLISSEQVYKKIKRK